MEYSLHAHAASILCARSATAPYRQVDGCEGLSIDAFANVANCDAYHAAYSHFCASYVNCSLAGAAHCCDQRLVVSGMEGFPTGLDGSVAYQYRGIYIKDAISRNGLADTYSQANGNGVIYVNPHLVDGNTWSIRALASLTPVARADLSRVC